MYGSEGKREKTKTLLLGKFSESTTLGHLGVLDVIDPLCELLFFLFHVFTSLFVLISRLGYSVM